MEGGASREGGPATRVTNSDSAQAPKKISLDEMSRDDLIKKCKGLLSIAQKAKLAKAEISEECEELKEKFRQLEIQKTADKESLKTMREFVDSLTEQKLTFATEVENLKLENCHLRKSKEESQSKLKETESKIGLLEIALRESDERLSKCDATIESLKRLNARYEKDNDDLISRLEKMETETKFPIENGEVVSAANDEVQTCRDALKELESKHEELLKWSEMEKIKKEKLNSKLKLYREKLIKCASSITQLKNCKLILLKTVAEYSQNVPKWKSDIVKASKLMSEELLRLENENKELQNRLSVAQNSSSAVTDDSANDSNALICKIEALESEKLILINEKGLAKDTIQKLENENSLLEETNVRQSKELQSLNSLIVNLKDSISLLEDKRDERTENYIKEKQTAIDSLTDELQTVKTNLVRVEEENKLLLESNDNLLRELKKISESSEDGDSNFSEHNKVLQADISKLTVKLTAYKTENSCLLHDIKEMKNRLAEAERMASNCEEMSAKLATYKNENGELLNEMKEMNEILKERGEIISKQHSEIVDANNKIKHLENEMETLSKEKEQLVNEVGSLKEKLSEKESRLKTVATYETNKINNESNNEKIELENQLEQKNSIIASLYDEIEKLKTNSSETVTTDTPDDNLSVSTVSHAEETSRLKDVDGMLEQKYAKLHRLAIKLKRKIGELSNQLKTLEEEKNTLSEENETLKVQNKQFAHNLQLENKLQSDAAGSNHDNLKDMQQLLKNVANANEKAEKLQAEINSFKKEKLAQDIIIKQYESDIKKLKGSVNADKEPPAEIVELKTKLAAAEAQLTSEITKHKQTLESLEKAKRDVKKKNVLSLEMEDYERSMKDLTTKMEENKKKIIQMESTIDTQEGTISSLRTQIKMLEDQLKTEENIVKESQELLNNATENSKEREAVIVLKDEEISKLQKEIENLRVKGEEMTLQLTTALGEKEKSVTVLNQEKNNLSGKLKRSESRFVELENEMQLKTTELDNIKTEFNGYKIRAQALLRQNQNKDLDNEENLKQEINTLKSELKIAQENVQIKQTEYELLLSEKSRLTARANELQLLVSALQTEREKVSEQFNDQLQKEILEQKNMKIQIATLTQCYKKQIADLEDKSTIEISNLKKELEFAHASLLRANSTKNQVQTIESNSNRKELQFVAINNVCDKNEAQNDFPESSNEINVMMLEREEGEGSESTPSPSPTYLQKSTSRRISRNNREPVPLEQLLEEGVPDENSEFYSDHDLETKLADAMKQIDNQNKRLAHLTELVAEAEREVMRRSQLTEALKEEVRRYQRSMDRAAHHHNQEYLKNVIIKFLTLSSGDERSRLVPVLHTILTLSPEETHQLTAVAKGQDPNSNRSWGSYLPWPGNTKN